MSTSWSTPDGLPVAGIDLARPSLASLVVRPRLLERLERATAPLILLSAPSGYGKSVLLAHRAARDSRPYASLTLGDAHNDPILLLEWVIDALDRIEPLPAGVAAALAGSSPDVEGAVLPKLAEALSARRRGAVLVIDELEHLESPQSLAVITSLAENARAGTQIAIATRVDPPLPLARLRADLAPLGIERVEGNCEPEDHAATLCEIMSGIVGGQLPTPAGADQLTVAWLGPAAAPTLLPRPAET